MATNGEIVKRKLMDLRVVDLKAELENRNLDKAGIKAVLQERLQQALDKEGHNFEEYFFEVTESPIAKKPTKRTNKKLTRDDESETHSNLDESQNDLNLEDDDKFDSDEDRIDEKFFQVLETTEDTINLSIEEEEEKLLIEEDICSESEKQADESFKRNGKSSGEPQADSHAPKREMTKSQALSSTSSNNTSEQDAREASGERSEVGANVKDAATKSDRDQGKVAVGGGGGSSNNDSSGTRIDDSGKGEAGGNVVSSSAAKTSSNSNGNESKENAPAEGNSSVGSSAAIVRQEETSSGATTVTTSPNKAKSAAVKEGTKLAERAKLARPMISCKNLWVTGLSSATRATDLKSLFSKHGKVLGAKVVSNARSSVSRCYGFITMATAEEASKCIQHLHRTELHGRMISVERAKADPLGPGRKVAMRQTPIITKKTPLKKDAPSSVVGQEKKLEEDISEKKEKAKVKDDEIVKESSEPPNKVLVDEGTQAKEGVVSGDNQNEEKSSKKSDDRRDSVRRSTRDSRERRGSERPYEHHRENFLSHRRPYFRDNKFVRRPFTRRPVGYRPMMRRTTLTFDRIRAERLRQRARDEERELRDSERKRRLDVARQREIERRQREEAMRLEREREKLRIEREKLERERAEVLKLEREKQKLERERIEREREELRRRERMSFNSRMDEHRRPVKRSYNSFHSGRDAEYEERKRTNISGGPRRIENFERRSDHRTESIRGGIGRRDSHVPERATESRTERFERGPISRDTDLRGHGREDRSVSYRDSSDIGQSRTVKDDWKGSSDRGGRGHRDSSKGLGSGSYGNEGGRSGGESRYGDRGNDTWHSNSQSESRSGGGSKPYNTGGSGGSGGWGGTDRKSDSQWGSRNDNWGSGAGGSGCSGGIGSGRSQQLGINPSMMSQGQSSMFESGSGSGGGGSSGLIGMGISGGGSSYSSDRFESYKGLNSMRRY